ncbi:LysE/ArgO family amino acid transporter [Corynebacterium sp. ACRPQ]|uniref:LysE/ArgO family amino acid transporter n=1 Tax=Corynebacterium sp. ACRPQ TaxID=2918201 RepID=UPI001EF28E38|nr:LysE family transporter [Corynebacterium sp. ACRPQ]MCG7441068.1 LysE family transporter [Corynebacterium sp. ACRPQ]
MSIVLAGFFLGLSLIVAVGPQNAMLLKYGIRRDHIGLIIVVCALSDVILITSGTAGVGYLVEKFPNALQVLKYVGAAYLAYFTFTCFRDAFKTKGEAIEVESTQPKVPQEVASFDGSRARNTTKTATRVEIKRSPSWVKPLLTALALTWLNPGAYVDVVVMLGGIANQYGESGRWLFAVGAICASFTWFPFIGFGAARFSHVLSRPTVWRWINFGIGVIMIGLTLKLLLL